MIVEIKVDLHEEMDNVCMECSAHTVQQLQYLQEKVETRMRSLSEEISSLQSSLLQLDRIHNNTEQRDEIESRMAFVGPSSSAFRADLVTSCELELHGSGAPGTSLPPM